MEGSIDLALMIHTCLGCHNLEPCKVLNSLSEFRNPLLLIYLLIIFSAVLPPHLCSLKPSVLSFVLFADFFAGKSCLFPPL